MPTVLFVCVENAFRSQMAEGLFNEEAPEGWSAESAGIRPAAAVRPDCVAVMAEIDVDLSGKTPRPLTPDLAARAIRIVTMGCGPDACPPGFEEKTETWDLPNPKGMSLEEVRSLREEIRERVLTLIEEIERDVAVERGLGL
jgi:protein-tyrosine-phosphatase